MKKRAYCLVEEYEGVMGSLVGFRASKSDAAIALCDTLRRDAHRAEILESNPGLCLGFGIVHTDASYDELRPLLLESFKKVTRRVERSGPTSEAPARIVTFTDSDGRAWREEHAAPSPRRERS